MSTQKIDPSKRANLLTSPNNKFTFKLDEIMDWVIRAAKKKTEQPAGGSRSIVESLNVFNNVDSDYRSQLNSILNESNSWLNDQTFLFDEKLNKLELGRSEIPTLRKKTVQPSMELASPITEHHHICLLYTSRCV